MSCDFSLSHYQEIIDLFKIRGFTFGEFGKKYDDTERIVYYRHDLDFSIKAALPLAEIENLNGIKAYYSIRLCSPFENVFASKNIKVLRKIASMGHKLIIHLEEDLCYNYKRAFERQKEILKFALSIEDNIVSFHRPTEKTLGKDFKGFISTYNSEYFTSLKYLSDAMGIWRSGCPCKWLSKPIIETKFQILTHPIWWGRDEKGSLKKSRIYIRKLFKVKMKDIEQDYKEDNPYYQCLKTKN